MHHPVTIFLLLLVLIFLLTRRPVYRPKPGSTAANKPLQANLRQAEKVQPQAQLLQEDEKLSSDEGEQLRQALALHGEIKALGTQFEAISARLPAVPEQDEGEVAARKRESTIITEQLRIAGSYSDELMRFVMAPYQSNDGGRHVPSVTDAAWALTAAYLTLSFVRARIVALT